MHFFESKSCNKISNRFCNEINAKNVNKTVYKSLKFKDLAIDIFIKIYVQIELGNESVKFI